MSRRTKKPSKKWVDLIDQCRCQDWTENDLVGFLDARDLLNYIPSTGRYGGVQTMVAKKAKVSRQYVHQVLFPELESRIFASAGDSNDSGYWRVWAGVRKNIDESPHRWRWETWRNILTTVAGGVPVFLERPGAPVYKILINRLKALAIPYTAECHRRFPHNH